MPELPEVETVRSGLSQRIDGHSVVEVVGGGPRLFRKNPGGLDEVKYTLLGARLTEVQRRGKYLWLPLTGAHPAEGDPAFVIHLGMSGQVHWQSPALAKPKGTKHEHLWLQLSNGAALSFVDQRTFGHLTTSTLARSGCRLVPELITHIAPDPFDPDFSPEWVSARASTSKRAVKTLLLDQNLISGVGNIYADEALYRAGLHGKTRGCDLNKTDWERLLAASTKVMGEAIEAGGTSFDELYVDVEGNPGYFSRKLRVYGREGAACYRCGSVVERMVIGGRSTHWCPRCQPLP